MLGLNELKEISDKIVADIKAVHVTDQRFVAFSDWSAANIYLFRRTYQYVAEDHDDFLVSGKMRDGRSFFLPRPSIALGLRKLSPDEASSKLTIYPMAIATENGNVTDHSRDQADYIYDCPTFLTFPGPAFRRERQGMRALVRTHDCVFRETQPNDLGIIDEWLRKKFLSFGDADSIEFREALEYLEALGLDGISAIVDGKLSGVIVFDKSIKGTVIVLFAKTIHRNTYLLHLLYQNLAQRMPPGTKINLCQDLGIHGLRAKKLLLRPSEILPKFTLETSAKQCE